MYHWKQSSLFKACAVCAALSEDIGSTEDGLARIFNNKMECRELSWSNEQINKNISLIAGNEFIQYLKHSFNMHSIRAPLITLGIVSACFMVVDLKTVPDYHREDFSTEEYASKSSGLNKYLPLSWVSQIKDINGKCPCCHFSLKVTMDSKILRFTMDSICFFSGLFTGKSTKDMVTLYYLFSNSIFFLQCQIQNKTEFLL